MMHNNPILYSIVMGLIMWAMAIALTEWVVRVW